MANYNYTYDTQEKEKNYTPPKLQTNRSMWKLMIFSLLTLGIYSIIFFIPFSFDIDKVAPKADRSKTMNYLLAFFISLFTVNIMMDIWHYQIAVRVSEALERRNIDYEFGTEDFWCWFFFGSLILVGPFIYFHKLCKAMNLLCEHYNADPSVYTVD